MIGSVQKTVLDRAKTIDSSLPKPDLHEISITLLSTAGAGRWGSAPSPDFPPARGR